MDDEREIDLPELTLRATDVDVRFKAKVDSDRHLRDRLKRGRDADSVRIVHAVRGVSLELRRGESIGIVGRNGSGKSTLMLALAGLVPLTGGEVLATSRPTVLGVSSVLNQHLSGRRNIVMGALALGLRGAEVNERLEELIEFSGLRDSIDLPMKTYSSGMRARIVFTIATVMTPEILLIDEALAVGDKSFRSKARERIDEIIDRAGSVVVVSHNLDEIKQLCTRAMWIDAGEIVTEGPTADVVRAYESSS